MVVGHKKATHHHWSVQILTQTNLKTVNKHLKLRKHSL